MNHTAKPHREENLQASRPTLLQLIDAEQSSEGWTDADLERNLGLENLTMMALIRKGVVQFSYGAIAVIQWQLKPDALDVAQALICSHMTDAIEGVAKMKAQLTISPDSSKLVSAYADVVNGECGVTAVDLPHAAVLIVPKLAMKGATARED